MTASSCAAIARQRRLSGWRCHRPRRAAAMSSRRRGSMGIARVFLGCAKAAPVGRGHEHPHGKKKRLRNGHDVGEAADCRDQRVSPALPDVHGPPSPVGFGISRVLGSAAPSGSAAESAPRQLASLPNGIASLQGPSARQGTLPSDCTADRRLARRHKASLEAGKWSGGGGPSLTHPRTLGSFSADGTAPVG